MSADINPLLPFATLLLRSGTSPFGTRKVFNLSEVQFVVWFGSLKRFAELMITACVQPILAYVWSVK